MSYSKKGLDYCFISFDNLLLEYMHNEFGLDSAKHMQMLLTLTINKILNLEIHTDLPTIITALMLVMLNQNQQQIEECYHSRIS